MLLEAGIIFALGALIFWAIGDFLIQRSTRKLGDWEPLLLITLIGAIILTPFVYGNIQSSIFSSDITLYALLGVGAAMFCASILDFEALRKGKIAVIEPLFALEVPVTVFLAIIIFGETLDLITISLIVALITGTALLSLKSAHLSKKVWLERGALIAIASAMLFGISNFMIGFASRATSSLITLWFINIFIALMCAFYLIQNKLMHRLAYHIMKNKKLIISVSLTDNMAWVCFATAASLIPLSIAISVSEGYIALAALLGLIINREKLMHHQKLGLVVALLSAILLAYVYG